MTPPLDLRFLFVANTPRDPLAGASGADMALIGALRDLGHQVDEVWSDSMPRNISHPNLHQLLELPRNFAHAVNRKCAAQSYDVIQVNQPHAWLAAKQHQLQKRRGVFINRSHGWEPALRKAVKLYGAAGTDKRSIYRKALSRLIAFPLERHNSMALTWSDGVVLCSMDDLDFITTTCGTNREKLLALAPGIPSFFFQGTQSQDPDRWKRMLYVGNFIPPKAPEVVASVFQRVLQACSDATATWVCPKESHGNVRKLLGEDANERVTLRDWLTKEELRDQMDRHGIFLFPSYFEGFSLTFLQAMARGMCVLGTNIDGMRQAITDQQDGFLFERGQPQAMAESANYLMANPARAQQVSDSAKQTARNYTWQQSAQAYVQFCRNRLSSKTSQYGSEA